MAKPWSDDEIELLKKLFPVRKTQELADQLGRYAKSVAYKARQMGIKKAKGHFFWSTEELKLLKKIFPYGSIEHVAYTIGRSVKSVRAKAHKMGLKRRKKRRD